MEPSSEFPEGKEAYCPRCYFDREQVVLRKDCPGHAHNGSHSHCWDQKTPACGQPLEKHTQCCLCDMPYSEKETETKPQVSSSSVVGDKLDVKSQPEWVKEFDRMFKVLETATAVKSFISRLLESERAKWEKERQEETLTEIMLIQTNEDAVEKEDNEIYKAQHAAYSQALSDALQKLSEQLNKK